MLHKSPKLLSMALAGALIGASGCTDLEENVLADIPASEYGSNEAEFIAALGSAYTTLFGLPGGHGGYWSIVEISTDEGIIPQRGSDWNDGGIWLRTHAHQWNSSEPGFNSAWGQFYSGVATCNKLIEQLNEFNPELAPPFINELRGLRALYYYWLLDNFGNVPVVTSFSDAEALPATQDRAQVYAFLEQELTDIIPTLDPTSSTQTYARINQSAARAILAKLYLNAEVYTGTPQWEKAAAVADDIINSGNHSLLSSYHANFASDNGPNNEVIFAVPYDQVFGRNFNLGAQTGHYVTQTTFGGLQQPWNGFATLGEFYNSYDSTDIRRGEAGNQQVPGNFLAGAQFGPGGGGDPLTDPSADDPGGPEVIFKPELRSLGLDDNDFGSYRDQGIRVFKYNYQQGYDPGNMDNDFPIFRYADILLVKAEAMFRMDNSSSDALDLVNMVRMRAGVEPFEALTEENLLAERGREMFMEMWRRNDLIRFGQFTSGEWQFKEPSEEFRNLFPIPPEQIQTNPNLRQNPGY